MLGTALVALAIIAIAALAWTIHRRRDDVRFAAAEHSPGARLVSHAHLIDGRNHIPVALTLGQQQILYGNADLDASIDIVQIDEVEYGSDLVTGGIADGAVLRLRSHGRATEFLLDMAAATKWSLLLPPHRLS
ncbi:MAG TPA: hypothetical protein VGJ81_10295 [Thermoanaerobaculia bacterium]|jgi:hypothetical protein